MYKIFKELCEKHGVTAYRVSKETGISTATLSDWKTGKTVPKADKMKKIADFFGVSTEYLMTGSDPEAPTWYTNPDTAAEAQKVFQDPNLRILFDAAKDSRPEDIRMAAEMLKRFKETANG